MPLLQWTPANIHIPETRVIVHYIFAADSGLSSFYTELINNASFNSHEMQNIIDSVENPYTLQWVYVR